MKLLIVFLFLFSVQANECYKAFGRLGTSINQGQPYKGVAKTNSYLKKKGFWKRVKSIDFGDIVLRDSSDFKIYEELFNKTLKIIERGYKPALIGGDHSQSFSTISALLRHYPNLKVLWVDAHADINTRHTSPSNNIHGMPVAGLLGIMETEAWNDKWLMSNLPLENIIYLGIRDIDPGERKFIQKYNIENYPMELIKKQGIEKVLSKVKEKWRDEPIHLSFDIDSLDSALVPATSAPVSDGMSLADALNIIKEVRSDLVSFELVEFNPDLAQTAEELKTTQRSVETLLSALFSSPKN